MVFHHSEKMSQSKQTSANLSKSEEEKLVALVDAITSKQEDAAWEKLAQQFNASSETNIIRTGKVLKENYNNIKRTLRMTKANAWKELFMTGGGAAPKDKEHSSPVLGQLSDVMGASFDGLPARHDDDQITSTTDVDDPCPMILSSEEFLDVVDENGAVIEKILFSDIIVDERETEIGRNENESVENYKAESPLDCSKYRPTMLHIEKNELLNTPSASKHKSADLVALEKQIFEQQLEHARLEHEQQMMHSAEEHKLRIKILEAELKSKQT